MYLDTDTRYLNVSIDTILDTFLFTTAFISFKTPYGLESCNLNGYDSGSSKYCFILMTFTHLPLPKRLRN